MHCQSMASTPSGAASPPISEAAGQTSLCTVIKPFGICCTHCMLWWTRNSQATDAANSAIVRNGDGGWMYLSGMSPMMADSGTPCVPGCWEMWHVRCSAKLWASRGGQQSGCLWPPFQTRRVASEPAAHDHAAHRMLELIQTEAALRARR